MKTFLFYLLLCQGAGLLGAVATRAGLQEWYPTLRKPWFNPPKQVFAPVWTLLYTLIALAAYRTHGDPWACRLFCAQLTLNALWSPLFFGLRKPGWALLDLALLWCSIALWIPQVRTVDPLSAYLLWPYWAWVSFAALLNFEIWRINRQL